MILIHTIEYLSTRWLSPKNIWMLNYSFKPYFRLLWITSMSAGLASWTYSGRLMLLVWHITQEWSIHLCMLPILLQYSNYGPGDCITVVIDSLPHITINMLIAQKMLRSMCVIIHVHIVILGFCDMRKVNVVQHYCLHTRFYWIFIRMLHLYQC